jgi:general secretion pathway protein E
MEVEPFLVASSLSAVLAQRLVRTICDHCREEHPSTTAEMVYLPSHISTLYRGKGCPKCRESGYLGRTGIFELLVVDAEIRRMISERVNAQEIKNYAVGKGMKTLFTDGVNKVMRGDTTLQEVLRVTQKDYADISV